MTKCWNAKVLSKWKLFWIKLLFLFPLSCGSDVSHYFTCLSHALCFVQKLWPNWLDKSFNVPLCMKMIKSCFLCLYCQYYVMAETYFFLRHCQTFLVRDECFYPVPWNHISQIRRWEITTKAKSNCRNMQNASFQCSQIIWKCWWEFNLWERSLMCLWPFNVQDSLRMVCLGQLKMKNSK